MRIGVIGASGGTGTRFVEIALDAGHDVVAIVRTPAKVTRSHEHLSVVAANVRDAGSLVPALRGLDALVAMFGTTDFSSAMKASTLYSEGGRNLVHAMKDASLTRLVLVSSSGVIYDPSANLVWNAMLRPMFWRIYSDMSLMELIVSETALQWTIVRPPELIDGPETGTVHAAHDAVPTSGTPRLTRADLARFVLGEVEAPQWMRQRPVLAGKR